MLEVNGRKISISCYYNIMVNITEQTVGIYWPLVCSVFLLLLLFWSRFVIYYTHCVANTLLFSHNIFHSETEDKRATVYSRRRVREISAFFFFCFFHDRSEQNAVRPFLTQKYLKRDNRIMGENRKFNELI